MRPLRWLILAAFSLILAFVASTYLKRGPGPVDVPSAPLKEGVNLQAQKWSHTQTENGKEKFRIRASNVSQNKQTNKLSLEGVELEVPHKDGKVFDVIKTARGEWDAQSQSLFAGGDVEIIMNVPEGQEPTGRLMHIETSSVTFVKEGTASTDKPITFVFDRGDGKGVGADYKPSEHELVLKSQVELNWIGANPKAKPIHVQSENAVYKEKEEQVLLSPWSTLDRDTMSMEAGPATIQLKKGRMDTIETTDAKGVQKQPGRTIEYSAKHLTMNFTPKSVITKIVAEQDAVLVSSSDAARTQINAGRIDMDFEPDEKESVLKKAIATGNTIVESKPLPRPKVQMADTKILKSEIVELNMKPGGQDIDTVITQTPGDFELIPNRPEQPHRWLKGERFWIQYGDNSQIQSFKSTNASTRTENPPKPVKAGQKKPENPPVLTSSKTIAAEFDPANSQMTKLDQDQDFKYEAGERRAVARHAVLDQTQDLITLDGAARVWDLSGSTNGDRIVINQKTSAFTADGNVNSSRMPDKKGNSSALSNKDEPTQAKAQKMVSLNNNRHITYEGGAVVWQGANRITADRVEIDRETSILRATGNVNSQFVDKQQEDQAAAKPKETPDAGAAASTKAATKKKKSKPKPAGGVQGASIFTIVKAPELVYTEDDRLAHYKGGVLLTRPGLVEKSLELRAYLNDSSEESSLDRAIGDGQVEIVHTSDTRKRTGTAEHSEYYVDDDKMILEGGKPRLVDSLKGRTEGRQLTYFFEDERLLVDGVEEKRGESLLLKNKKKR
jgi:lipopolysaccharide export system protein LptA